jgi:hypothetical protein
MTIEEKALSERPIGYVIAALCGVAGGPVGIGISPLVLLLASKIINKDADPKGLRWIIWAAIGIPMVPILLLSTNMLVALFTPVVLGSSSSAKRLSADALVTAVAKECAVKVITESLEPMQLPDDVTGKCHGGGGSFTSQVDGLRTQAKATTAADGVVTLVQKAR